METKLLLVKAATLLYRESQLINRSDNSSDLIRTVIETIKVPDVGLGINGEREEIAGLKDLIVEMTRNSIDHEYDKTDLLQRLRVICGENERLYDAFQQGIDDELSESALKRNILNTRKSLNNHFREQQVADIFNKASYEFKFKKDTIKDIGSYIGQVIAQLEPFQQSTNLKDPAVINDIDVGNDESLKSVVSELQTSGGSQGGFKLGWSALNRMIQGKIDYGSMVLIPALQHKYKTGFSLTLFKQLALYNKPRNTDPNKKPLLLRISFEDKVSANLQFLYQSLKFDETRQYVDITNVSIEEITEYVKKKMQVNGYHVRMMHVDPTQWSYRHLCNKIIELEAQGYVIEACMVDYLGLVPTIGCVTSGPIGTDMRDLFRRIRNFFASKGITFITPHQLSSDAKQLLRGGTPESEFVNEVAEKGYFSGSKQLDQEVDLEIYIHTFKHNRKWWLAVRRGKHRVPTIVSDEDKYFVLPFPKGMPIPDDAEGEDQSFRKVPNSSGNVDDEFFK